MSKSGFFLSRSHIGQDSGFSRVENRENPNEIDNNDKHTIARKGFIARTTYFYVGFKNHCQSLRKGQIMNTQVALFFAVLLLQFIGLC